MAFGKIAVIHPNGDSEEHELTKPTTSVGRQPGNDIVLPTSAVSRYHAQFDVSEGAVYLVDLGTVNGTFVNDRQVESNGRIALGDGDVIVIGDMQMQFQVPEARSGSKRAELVLDTEASVTEQAGVPFRLILDEPQQSVAPGARLQMTLIMENLENYEYPVTVELRGLEPEWAKSNRREALLEPGVQTQAMISVRPPRSSQTRPGLYPLTVRVALKEDPSKALEAVREIDIVGYAGLGVAMRHGRADEAYHLAVQNQGNVPIDICMDGYQRERLLRFRFEPDAFTLPAGQTQQVSLAVSPAAGRPFGSRKEIPFAVVTRSLDAAGFQAPLMGVHTLRPTWPAWLLGASIPMLLGALLVFAVVAVGIYIVFFSANASASPTVTAQPVAALTNEPVLTAPPIETGAPTQVVLITAFYPDDEQVVYNTVGSVTLRWEFSNPTEVEDIQLEGPDGRLIQIAPADISSRSYTLPIASLSPGANRYRLTVIGTDSQPHNWEINIEAVARVCTLVENATIYTRAETVSAHAPDATSAQIAILGRTEATDWLFVAYNDLESLTTRGWIPVEAAICGAVPPLTEHIIANSGSITPPDVPPTETTEP